MNIVNGLAVSALDGLVLRQQVTANNIANINTPNYRPYRVDFERALESIQAGWTNELDATVSQDNSLKNQHIKSHLNNEIRLLSETTLQYQSIIKSINKQLALMQLAISEGRR